MSHLDLHGVTGQMVPVLPRDAGHEDLRLVHTRELIARVMDAAPAGEHRWLDVDTYVAPASYSAALRAAGGLLAAVDGVLAAELDSAFCFVRPPGHHATPASAMGFCLFNNVAIAAAHALERRELDRVAIVDFDVHHGNGTQDTFYADPRVLYFSTHQFPFYPGTGDWSETGVGKAMGNTINVPLPRGCGDDAFIAAYEGICAPALRRFKPQMILVSAGFDAHFADPLAQELLSTAGYYRIASLLGGLASELCGGRIVYALEGGYDLKAISWSAHACVDALLGNEFTADQLGAGPQVRGPDVGGLLARIKGVHGLSPV
jgi:acetoin utilization deacetylase AcuC-like enzyme